MHDVLNDFTIKILSSFYNHPEMPFMFQNSQGKIGNDEFSFRCITSDLILWPMEFRDIKVKTAGLQATVGD